MVTQDDYLAWRAFDFGLRVAKNALNLSLTLDQYLLQHEILGQIADGEATIIDSPADYSDTTGSPAQNINRPVILDRQLAEMIRRFVASQLGNTPP